MKLRSLSLYTACLLIVPTAIWQVYKRLLRAKEIRNMGEKKEINSEEEEKVDFAKQRAEFNERLKHLDKVERTKEMQKRYERYKDFDKFQDIAKDAFENLRDNDPRGLIYEAFNMLCVCPGSRMGMNKRDIVEVFWGSKIYDSEYKDNSGNGSHFKFNTEKGATLYFLRKDNGLVGIYLFPSVTEKRQYEETGIILKENVNPKCLLRKFYLRRLWWSFMAYTEVTSLDGSPSIWQRIRVAKNRFVKPMIVGNEVKQRVVVNWIGKTIWWITTVGLSGCLITTFYDWKNNGNDEIQNRIERIDRTLIQQTTNDSIEVKEISKRIDSLNMNLRHLIKVQEKKR